VSDSLPLPSALSVWMNAAGFYGFTPAAASILSDRAGAFVTPAISKTPRSPARNRCLVEFEGGFLLHTGYPNEGFNRVLKHFAHKWANLKVPVWPHLIVHNGYECGQMVRDLEGVENIGAVEISLPGEAEASFVEEILQSAMGELPLYISVPFQSPWQNWLDLFRLYTVSGIVLAAPRGNLIVNDAIISGRLYGPSLFPQMLEKINAFQSCGIPLVAGSGIFSIERGVMALQAGASAVQLDACLWQLSSPTSPSRS
jgi:dihydroorotate dehydrogenase